MIGELIAGAVALGVTSSGWIYAYRARGESRDALERANQEASARRLAESGRDVALSRALDADARAVTAAAELRAARLQADAFEAALKLERTEKGMLLETLATMGAPVGGAVLDHVIGELYPDEDRGPASPGGDSGPVSGADRSVPDDAADAADKAASGR